MVTTPTGKPKSKLKREKWNPQSEQITSYEKQIADSLNEDIDKKVSTVEIQNLVDELKADTVKSGESIGNLQDYPQSLKEMIAKAIFGNKIHADRLNNSKDLPLYIKGLENVIKLRKGKNDNSLSSFIPKIPTQPKTSSNTTTSDDFLYPSASTVEKKNESPKSFLDCMRQVNQEFKKEESKGEFGEMSPEIINIFKNTADAILKNDPYFEKDLESEYGEGAKRSGLLRETLSNAIRRYEERIASWLIYVKNDEITSSLKEEGKRKIKGLSVLVNCQNSSEYIEKYYSREGNWGEDVQAKLYEDFSGIGFLFLEDSIKIRGYSLTTKKEMAELEFMFLKYWVQGILNSLHTQKSDKFVKRSGIPIPFSTTVSVNVPLQDEIPERPSSQPSLDLLETFDLNTRRVKGESKAPPLPIGSAPKKVFLPRLQPEINKPSTAEVPKKRRRVSFENKK